MAVTIGTAKVNVRLVAQLQDGDPIDIGTIDLDLPLTLVKPTVQSAPHIVVAGDPAANIGRAIRDGLKIT